MSSSSAESEQWTCKQGSNNIEERESALHQYDHVKDNLADKHRCDDAVSSNATHGSVSTSEHDVLGRRTDASPTSNGKATGDGGDEYSTRKSSPDSSIRTHMFAGKALPTNCSSREDRSYCLERFLRDVDTREEARLSMLDGTVFGRSRERRKDGAGRRREGRVKSRECHYDQTSSVKEGEEEQENDGAA